MRTEDPQPGKGPLTYSWVYGMRKLLFVTLLSLGLLGGGGLFFRLYSPLKGIDVHKLGRVELSNATLKKGSGEDQIRPLMQGLSDWYIYEKLVPRQIPEDNVKILVRSVKSSPAIIVRLNRIPKKDFWIPLVGRPSIILLEDLDTGKTTLFSAPMGEEVNVDFADSVWPDEDVGGGN